MSFSSQHDPRKRPPTPLSSANTNTHSERRLRTPAERFGVDVETASEESFNHERVSDSSSLPSEPSHARHEKTRHERHHFERERAARARAVRRQNDKARSTRHEKATNPNPAHSHDTSDKPVEESSVALQRIRSTRKRFWRRVAVFMVLFFVAQATYAAFTAPQFQIKSVKINGLNATPIEKIRPLTLSLLGQNAFRAPRGIIETKVEKLPTVESAHILLHAGLPPEVELRVIERKPMVRVGWNDLWWIADMNGIPYRRAKRADKYLPRLEWNEEIHVMKPLGARHWQNTMRLVKALNDTQGGIALNSENTVTKISPAEKSLPRAPLPLVDSMVLSSDGDATLVLNVSKNGNAPSPATQSTPVETTSTVSTNTADATGVAPNELKLRLGTDEWEQKIDRARVALAYFGRTGRDAEELNFVALDRPRWTPRKKITELNEGERSSS